MEYVKQHLLKDLPFAGAKYPKSKHRLQEIVDLQKNTPGCARTIYWANRRGFSRKNFKKIY
jgi:hypothetical protein